MSTAARRNLIFAWLAILSAAVGFMAWVEAAQEGEGADFDEINVRRANIIEPDGKPRVIISSRSKAPGIYWKGKEYRHHTRDEGGFIFFNDDGTEAGGLLFSNRKGKGSMNASSQLLFDHYDQQEAVSLNYRDSNGSRSAGLSVFDQPTQSLGPAIELGDKIAKATDPAQRAAFESQFGEVESSLKASGAFAMRAYVGKYEGLSVVNLADKQGHTRLLLKVTPEGAASIEFLDEAGKVVRRIPEK